MMTVFGESFCSGITDFQGLCPSDFGALRKAGPLLNGPPRHPDNSSIGLACILFWLNLVLGAEDFQGLCPPDFGALRKAGPLLNGPPRHRACE